jgi:hypothetical protein
VSSSVSRGTICSASPTTPMSQAPKIGAVGSVLIATMVADFSMPTRCWTAPEMPHAR